MDLRAYYRKLREIEQGLDGEFVVVKSRATPDGGVAGRLTEVSRAVAAKMLADGTAEATSRQEAEAHRKRLGEEKQREDKKRTSTQIQFTVLSEEDLRTLQKPARGQTRE